MSRWAAVVQSHWLLATLVAAPFLVQAGRIALGDQAFAVAGDHALIDLAVRDAADLRQSVGVYSRTGFFHPGPAMFYLLAPFTFVFGATAWSLVAATATVNGLLLGASVLVIGWRWGTGVAAGWALAAFLPVLAIGPALLAVPWNPILLVPLLTLALALSTAGDHPVTLSALLLAGSVLVHSHVAMIPIVSVLVIAAGAAMVARLRTPPPPARSTRWGWGAVVASAALAMLAVLAWVPPVLQQLRSEPGNLGLVIRYFASASEPPGAIVDSVAAAGRSLFLTDPQVTGSLDELGAGWSFIPVVVALVALAVVIRSRRADRVRLAAISALAILTATAAGTRISGSRFWYLTLWMTVTLVPLLAVGVAAAGAAMRRVVPRAGRPLPRALIGVGPVGILALVLGAMAVAGPVFAPPELPNFPAQSCQVLAMASAIDDVEGDVVLIQLPDDLSTWPQAAGVAVVLEARGARVVFGEEFRGYVPPHRMRVHGVDRTLAVLPADRSFEGVVLARTDELVLYERGGRSADAVRSRSCAAS